MDYEVLAAEMGVFAFFGLLYYIFQRRRIIHHSISEMFYILDAAIFKTHEFLDDKKNEPFYTKVNDFNLELEKINTRDDLPQLEKLLTNIPNELSDEIQMELKDVKSRISFHIKTKR